VAETQRARVEELLGASERSWSDPYEMSRKLRRGFRVGRRKRQEDERTGEALREKFGLGVEVLAEVEEDGLRAGFVEFGERSSASASARKPLFGGASSTEGDSKATSAAMTTTTSWSSGAAKADRKEILGSTLRNNTKIATDPFLRDEDEWQPRVKRKRQDETVATEEIKPVKAASTSGTALVGYDSDSS
jgi:coiled-coil domain-containing protein 130